MSSFFDTNVLVYTASSDTTKKQRAVDCLLGGGLATGESTYKPSTHCAGKAG